MERHFLLKTGHGAVWVQCEESVFGLLGHTGITEVDVCIGLLGHAGDTKVAMMHL